jgi:hypothetical protein
MAAMGASVRRRAGPTHQRAHHTAADQGEPRGAAAVSPRWLERTHPAGSQSPGSPAGDRCAARCFYCSYHEVSYEQRRGPQPIRWPTLTRGTARRRERLGPYDSMLEGASCSPVHCGSPRGDRLKDRAASGTLAMPARASLPPRGLLWPRRVHPTQPAAARGRVPVADCARHS